MTPRQVLCIITCIYCTFFGILMYLPMEKLGKDYFLFIQCKVLPNTISEKDNIDNVDFLINEIFQNKYFSQIFTNLYLGPAENGKKANESSLAKFSLENRSGLYSMWSWPQTAGLWWRHQMLATKFVPAGIVYPSILIGEGLTRAMKGTGQCSRIPSLMH